MPKIVDHDHRKSELSSAACAEIARAGIDKVRLIDIAARAGCTTGSLVHYFQDKHSLLLGALDHSIERMERRMRARLERTPPDHLGFLLEALPITAAGRIDNIVWYHFWAAALCDPVIRGRQRQAHRRWIAAVSRVLGALDGGGRAAGADRAEAAAATINGLMVRALLDPEEWPAERQEAVLGLAIDGLLAPDAASRRVVRTHPITSG